MMGKHKKSKYKTQKLSEKRADFIHQMPNTCTKKKKQHSPMFDVF